VGSSPSALIDFRAPEEGAAPLRLAFGRPREMLAARSIDEVQPLLRQAQALAREGAWCVGWLAYEAAGAFDAALRTHDVPIRGGPLARFLVYDAPLAPDDAALAWQGGSSGSARVDWHAGTDRAAFDDAIACIHAAIAAGELYQVNFTAPIDGELEGDPLALFDAMRRAQPKAYAAYIEGGDDADTVLSVSPELFFDWRGGRLLAAPMKGTAPRGAGPVQDDQARARLLASEKERAENVMIVDLLRNDLSRVAEPFSVKVLQLFHAEAWPTVWQLVSTIACRTRAGVGLPEVFGALFPCGSVTGAPKVQAMRMIRALEPAPRGIYCGAVGVIRPGGDATFNVPIRTLALRGRQVRCGIGSGITADASAADEWTEWRHKRAFAERASEPFKLLETLRLDNGRAVNAAAHLARMAGAAAHFGFAFDQAHAGATLQAVADRHPQGLWRVRLLGDRWGAVRAEAFAMEASTSRPCVELAATAIDGSDGEFFRFKTTRRAHYEAFAPASPTIFDTLLWNERGELTEFTRGNLALRIEGEWLTPALHCGLLPGVERARLLADGSLREAVLRREDLARAQAVVFFNSLRGWIEVRLPRTPA
jgi:para-aminobenzoate synthetase / 4-amino-4-deoxychorismate lyase